MLVTNPSEAHALDNHSFECHVCEKDLHYPYIHEDGKSAHFECVEGPEIKSDGAGIGVEEF